MGFKENKISTEELQDRKNWTLDQKIFHSLETISVFYNKYPNSKIAFSGGIDSTVMLRLCRMIEKNMPAIFANTTNEFIEIIKFVREVENVEIVRPEQTFIDCISKYGFPLVSKKVCKQIHDLRNVYDGNAATRNLYLTGYNREGKYCSTFKLAKKWLYLIDAPYNISAKCCDVLKKHPLNAVKTAKFIGTMAFDSQTRSNSYQITGCIDDKNQICKPLSIWTKDDIWNFVKKDNLKYCDIYDKGEHNTGCAFCGMGCHLEKESRFDRIKQREPKRYEQIMELKNNGVTYYEAIQTALKKPSAWAKIF